MFLVLGLAILKNVLFVDLIELRYLKMGLNVYDVGISIRDE